MIPTSSDGMICAHHLMYGYSTRYGGPNTPYLEGRVVVSREPFSDTETTSILGMVYYTAYASVYILFLVLSHCTMIIS